MTLQEGSARRYALLIGTAHYADETLSDLPAVEHDVHHLKAVLDDRGEFDDIIPLTDPTRDQASGALEQFYAGVGRGDTCLLYYSGHGLTDETGSALFLATRDTRSDRLHTSGLDASGLLGHLLGTCAAAEKIVLLDCCASGLFRAADRLRPLVRAEPRKQFAPRGTFVLTATATRRATFATADDAPSDFTAVLLRGLNGAAQTREDSGWITTHDLADHVHTVTASNDRLTPAESSEGVVAPIRLVRVASASSAERRVGVRASDDSAEGSWNADRWRQLIRYCTSAIVQQNHRQSYIPEDAFTVLHSVPVQVLSSSGAVLSADVDLPVARALAENADELFYGYPLVRVRASGNNHRSALAPLLTCTVRLSDDGTLQADVPPRPHPGLAALHGVRDNEYLELVQAVESEFGNADARGIVAAADLVRSVLGLELLDPLDPTTTTASLATASLGRVQNVAALWKAPDSEQMTKNLLEDLREIGNKPMTVPGTALAALADAPPVQARTGPQTVNVVAPEPLNEGQEAVVRSAMTTALTVAQGPPGTGKSQLVTAVLATAIAADQSVLIASTNNQAVDTVVKKVVKLDVPGLVVRTGNRANQDNERKTIGDLRAAFPSPTEHVDAPTCSAELRILHNKASARTAELDEIALLESEAQKLVGDVHRGRSLPVPLPDDEPTLRALLPRWERAEHRGLRAWLARRRLRRTFGTLSPTQVEEHAELTRSMLRFTVVTDRLAHLPTATEIWDRLQEFRRTDRPRLSQDLLRALQAERLRQGTAVLQERWEALNRTPPRSWHGFKNPSLLSVLPGWAVTTMSARVFPPQPALFDLVVIDEAAQCSVPHVLPLLYRAKRALIIGDPHQLPPVVTLESAQDRALHTAAGLSADWIQRRRLSYTMDSAYDTCACAARDVWMLEEHYRCHPQIVAGPAREIYHGRLSVLTDVTRLKVRTDQPVRWVDVPGTFQRRTAGSGSNHDEAAAVVSQVQALYSDHPEASIGVVSPLSPQVNLIEQLLREAGPGARGVHCGTVHRFQGGERDIMVLSPVGAPGIGARTQGWLCDKHQLWNVGITRAQSLLVVVGHQSWWRAQRGLLAGLAAGNPFPPVPGGLVQDSADRLHEELIERKMRVRRGVPLNGRSYDLVISLPDRAEIAVLLDDAGADPTGRRLRRVLAERDVAPATTPVVRLPLWQALHDPAACADDLLTRLSAQVCGLR
ncbi:MAG: hypothetical protein QG608_1636 [Actinomycetota bacterium]|nr:hypothetical protein [Actinomycetota bacterium]